MISVGRNVYQRCALSLFVKQCSPNMSTTQRTVLHDFDKKEFRISQGKDDAILQYKQVAPSVIDLEHTIVPKSFQGQGIGGQLAEAALKYAEEQKLKIKVSCGFVQVYLKKHPNSPFNKLLVKE